MHDEHTPSSSPPVVPTGGEEEGIDRLLIPNLSGVPTGHNESHREEIHTKTIVYQLFTH